jgi:hypothetical protein
MSHSVWSVCKSIKRENEGGQVALGACPFRLSYGYEGK